MIGDTVKSWAKDLEEMQKCSPMDLLTRGKELENMDKLNFDAELETIIDKYEHILEEIATDDLSMVLDDDLPDAFGAWLVDKTPIELINLISKHYEHLQ